jgi:MinD superfamily P-loop ATPase
MKKPSEIVILSGKGGTGKTSITAAFSSIAGRAVITDCDVDAADLPLLLSPEVTHTASYSSGSKAVIHLNKCNSCGICRDLCRFHAIEFIENEPVVDEFACEGCGLCEMACPVSAITMHQYEKNQLYFAQCRFGPMIYGKLGIAEENSGKLVAKIRQYAKETAIKKQADCIIMDGPPGIGCPVISSVTGVDLVVAVTEPTLSGWHDLERLIELTGRFQTPIKVIVNKCDLNETMTVDMVNKLDALGIEVLGKIPYDESMIHALLEGKTITEYDPEGHISAEVRKMWCTIESTVFETNNACDN